MWVTAAHHAIVDRTARAAQRNQPFGAGCRRTILSQVPRSVGGVRLERVAPGSVRRGAARADAEPVFRRCGRRRVAVFRGRNLAPAADGPAPRSPRPARTCGERGDGGDAHRPDRRVPIGRLALRCGSRRPRLSSTATAGDGRRREADRSPRCVSTAYVLGSAEPAGGAQGGRAHAARPALVARCVGVTRHHS